MLSAHRRRSGFAQFDLRSSFTLCSRITNLARLCLGVLWVGDHPATLRPPGRRPSAGACGLLLVLALLAGALLAVPVRAQVIDLSTLDGSNGFRLDGIDAVDLSGALLLRGASISARTSALGVARRGSIQP